jgi:hypothetical protein
VSALSVRQPWAELVVTGQKTIEVRKWFPPSRYMGQRVAIHAGRTVEEATPEVRNLAYQACPEWKVRTGGIIGVATLTDALRFWSQEIWDECLHDHWNPPEWWEPGVAGFVFSDAVRFEWVYRCPGALGFFEVAAREEELRG